MSNKYPGSIITSGANAGYSVAFDGTGDYLQAGSNAALAPGSGNFTLEFFVYPAGSANFMGLYQNFTDGLSRSTAFRISINATDNTSLIVQTQASALITTSAGVMTANAWNHVALVRNGSGSNNLVLYVNGVSRGTATNTTNFSDGFAQIGNTIYNGTNYVWNGYISNFRLVVGTAIYTAAFTPPTQLFNVPGTSLLTCNSPSIIDQSPNAFAITVNGDAKVSTVTPFTGYTAYNPALGASTPGVWTISEALEARQTRRWNMYDPYFNYTTLLLHGNGTNGAQNNTFLDISSNNFTITRNGNTTQGTFSPFSPTGWSNYFDGSGDYLNTPVNSAFDLGTGAFTIEAWFYPIDTISDGIVAIGNGTAWGAVWIWTFGTEIRLRATASTSGADLAIGGGAFQVGAWNHVAAVRSGNDFSLYLNGNRVATGTSTTALKTGCNAAVGSLYDTTYNGSFSGYISNVRIVKGGALYSGTAFTVPTSPLTTSVSAGTVSLLTCQNNRFIDNSSNAFAITGNGDASVQPFGLFNPSVAYTPTTIGGSGYFDGSGDYLSVGAAADWAFLSNSTAAWTIECWIYNDTSGTETSYFVTNSGSTNNIGIFVVKTTSETVRVAITRGVTASYVVDVTTTGTLVKNAWNHLFISYDQSLASSNCLIYINGASAGTGSKTANAPSASNPATALYIGTYNGSAGFISGYVSSLRISNSVRSVPSGVPTSPYTSDANTKLLANFTNAGIIDSTGDNVLETVGNAQISTAQSRFGGSSMYFDGTGDWLAFPITPSFYFGTTYTIEFWMYPTATDTTYRPIFSLSENNITGFTALQIYVYNGLVYADTRTVTSGSFTTITGSYTANVWSHVALSVSSTSAKLFINGTQVGSTSTFAEYPVAKTLYFGIGNWANGYAGAAGTGSFIGYIDDFRITKGYARYTSNFTPQTSQWQDQ